MFGRIMQRMARWYFRNAYQPVALDPQQPFDHPAQHHLGSVPWISTWETVCQSTALQMIAAHHGIERPRRHFDFLMGFSYGASYRGDFGFITVGTDPETGLLTAAPCLGLVRRYSFTDDAALYVRTLRSYLARGYPIRVPLDMGALYGQAKPLPHNEVLVGYDASGFTYYEPVSRPPAPCSPGHLPPGEPGLCVSDERLLQAVRRKSRLFGYPWRYPLVIFEPGDRRDELGQDLGRGRHRAAGWRGGVTPYRCLAIDSSPCAATRPTTARRIPHNTPGIGRGGIAASASGWTDSIADQARISATR
jgi:hypothetical protein